MSPPVIGAVQTVDWERATVFQVSFMSMLPHIETVNNVSTFSTISTGEEEAWCGCREIYQDVDPENTPPVVVIIPRLGPDGSTWKRQFENRDDKNPASQKPLQLSES
mmetsp:Transcript_20729/g.57539  ORF Transcript_20729/g.57539 Transcript_20729/m.57539 type:complete len:107 (+) Transcript_20729:281-601(+)